MSLQKEMDGMIKKALWIGIALSLFGFVSASSARADDWTKETKITFSQPVDVAGHVLVAGTYLFKMADANDRHIVRIFSANGKKVIATVMTIPDHRLTATDKTVMKFREVPAGSPEALRAWFYPGRTIGEEFVYPKHRAIELAKASKVIVPAHAAEVVDDESAKTVEIVAITPEEKEVPVTAAIQTTPVAPVAVVASNSEPTQLPKTASALPLVVLLGFASVGLAIGLMVFGKRETVATV
jgi:hypothetical protein